MDNVRILHGWTKDERKELEEAKDNGFLSVIALFCSIKRDDDNCHALYGKYYREDTNGNNQMAKDIADYYAGVAKFPDKKYYVHFIKGDSDSYLNYGLDSKNYYTSDKEEISRLKTQFTKEEIRAINPNYLLFIEEVPNDKLDKVEDYE